MPFLPHKTKLKHPFTSCLFITYLCVLFSSVATTQAGGPFIENADHPNPRMRYKVVQSHFNRMDSVFAPLAAKLDSFGQQRYEALKPLIAGKDITSLQQHVQNGLFSYTELTLYFLYRMRLYETDSEKTLHALISLAPDALEQAAWCDQHRSKEKRKHLLFGMPLLIKDNIGVEGTSTTAGAAILKKNDTPDAFIIARLREKGAIILGKTNLSEWAYYFCNGCPLGYSALGGQTMNPFGRKKFEAGGSSSGSGAAMAAGYAVATIGTETAGSILSPSSLNSLVGLKPTVGLLSRQGIVPISSTLDTPGPMTGNVADNAILLDGLMGYDSTDTRAIKEVSLPILTDNLADDSLKGKRFGIYSALLEISAYTAAIQQLKVQGAEIISLDTVSVPLPGYLSLLNHDMKKDLATYLQKTASPKVAAKSIRQIMDFNLTQPNTLAPYGQALFEGIEADTLTGQAFEEMKARLLLAADQFFTRPQNQHQIDFFLSVNNLHAAYAALAFRPCLTIPIQAKSDGEPQALTIIGRSWQEEALLRAGFQIEKVAGSRSLPSSYP